MEGESQSLYAQNMKSVFPINMVLYVVSEPMILGFRSKIKNSDDIIEFNSLI